MNSPRNINQIKQLPYYSQDKAWWQKPRHTLLGRALEAFQTGQSARGCAALRRLSSTKHFTGPFALTKALLIILTLLISYSSCNQRQGEESQTDSQLHINNTQKAFESVADIDRSIDKVQYIVFNGIITDTIYLDSLIDKATIHDAIVIGEKSFLSYAINSLGLSTSGEDVNNFIGHYICSIDSMKEPMDLGKTFDPNSLITSDIPYNLGRSCSNEKDIIKIYSLSIIPDSSLYFYAAMPQCSEWYQHIIIEYKFGQFQELFSIESSDTRLIFKLENDTILKCDYTEVYEDGIDKSVFRYNTIRRKKIN